VPCSDTEPAAPTLDIHILLMRQWAGRTLSSGQTIVLLTYVKPNTNEIQDDIQLQIEHGRLIVLQHENTDAIYKIDSSSVDGVISYAADQSLHNSDLLAGLIAVLKPGGFLVLYEPLQGRTFNSSEELSRRLILSGFINTKIAASGEFIEVCSEKPDWEAGASQNLRLSSKKSSSANLDQNDVKNIWTASHVDEHDIIDEDSLLSDSDRTAKLATRNDDCDVGKKGRKACKNCTCGRAQQADNAPRPRLTLEMLENPGVNSSCGSCGLGDAFRCAGCPYRGLPPFKVGEKITLPASFLEDDI
jgi:hypothetical protein